MDNAHREYVLEVFSDQTYVKDIVKGRFGAEKATDVERSCMFRELLLY